MDIVIVRWWKRYWVNGNTRNVGRERSLNGFVRCFMHYLAYTRDINAIYLTL